MDHRSRLRGVEHLLTSGNWGTSRISVFFAFLFSCAGFAVAEGPPDERVRIPFDVISQSTGMAVGSGVDLSYLGTATGVKSTVFSRKRIKTSDNPVTEVDWRFEFQESLRQITENSVFAVRASANGFNFSVAANRNSERMRDLNKNTIRILVYARYDARKISLKIDDMASLEPKHFSDSVNDLLEKIRIASQEQDFENVAQIRMRFRNLYGDGFISEISEGGMFLAQKTESVSSESDKSQLKQNISIELGGMGWGAKGQLDEEKRNTETVKTTVTNISGMILGGKPEISEPNLPEFKKIANNWFQTVEKGNKTKLEAVFVPYSDVPYLRSIVSRPENIRDIRTRIVGYFGPPERAETGAIISYLQGWYLAYGAVPIFQPQIGWITRLEENEFRLLLSVDPTLVAKEDSVGRIAAWRSLKKGEEDYGLHPTGDDPEYLPETLIWPILEIRSSDRKEAIARILPKGITSGLPVGGFVDAERAGSDDQDKPGWFTFDIGQYGSTFETDLEEGRVFLRSVLSADLMNVYETEGRQMVGAASPSGVYSFDFPSREHSEEEKWLSASRLMTEEMIEEEFSMHYLRVIQLSRYKKFTRGYFASKTRHRDFQCRKSTAKGRKLPEGYRYLEVAGSFSNPHKRVGADPDCGVHADYCTPGENEVCEDFWVSKACGVNKKWLTWYEEHILKRELRSDDYASICIMEL